MPIRISIAFSVICLSLISVTSAAYLNETDVMEEADYCNLQFPASILMMTGQSTPLIYGRIYEQGVTEPAGASAMVIAEVGYGPSGSDPTTSMAWQWFPATFNVQLGNDDEYQSSFVVNTAGTYAYTYRFSLDGGTDWTAADLNGAGSNSGLTFEPSQLGVLTVTPEPSVAGYLLLSACGWIGARRRRAS